jgi:hypothetical protein
MQYSMVGQVGATFKCLDAHATGLLAESLKYTFSHSTTLIAVLHQDGWLRRGWIIWVNTVVG